MSAIAALLRSRPIIQYRKDRLFYLRYDFAYFLGCLAFLAMAQLVHLQPVFQSWHASTMLLLPLACYAVILGHVFAHNAAHGNFPKTINRLVGELAGIVVLSRFASWEIIHLRHHQYSDDLERDPHPNVGGYWKTYFHTFVNVERQLQQNFLDFHGDTDENRSRERIRAYISYATNIVLIACWARLLGLPGFFLLFFPASIIGSMHLIHFNWSTHNGMEGKDFKPTDLNRGLFWLGNKLFFGIYAHDTHHKNPKLFNPAAGE